MNKFSFSLCLCIVPSRSSPCCGGSRWLSWFQITCLYPTLLPSRAGECLPHLPLLWPMRITRRPTTGRGLSILPQCAPAQHFLSTFLKLQLPDLGHKGERMRDWVSKIIPPGKASSHAGPSGGRSQRALPATRERHLHSSADDLLSASGATWPTCQSQMTEPLTVTLERQFVLASQGQNSEWNLDSESLHAAQWPVNRSLIFLCSKLAADSDENKLWPTFGELPLSSSSPRNQGVPQWGRIEKWNAWPGSPQTHGDDPHQSSRCVLWRKLRKGLGGGYTGLQHCWAFCFFIQNGSESSLLVQLLLLYLFFKFMETLVHRPPLILPNRSFSSRYFLIHLWSLTPNLPKWVVMFRICAALCIHRLSIALLF